VGSNPTVATKKKTMVLAIRLVDNKNRVGKQVHLPVPSASKTQEAL
jgi:hypothetical protein